MTVRRLLQHLRALGLTLWRRRPDERPLADRLESAAAECEHLGAYELGELLAEAAARVEADAAVIARLKPPAPTLPDRWQCQRAPDNTITIMTPSGGGVIVSAVSTAPRYIPEEVLHELASALMKPLRDADDSAAHPAPVEPGEADQRAVERLMFDALGAPRIRFVRVLIDGKKCIVPPAQVADVLDAEDEPSREVADVWLSEREFEDLPEFEGGLKERDARIAASDAEIARLKAEAAKSERRALAFGDLVSEQVSAMRAAVVDGHLKSPEEGLRWIANSLIGPGHYPDIEKAARAEGGAQAMFDREIAELEAFRAAHPAPEVKG